MSMRNPLPVRRHFGLTGGQWHFTLGLGAMVASVALVLYVAAILLDIGSASCPADTGTVPVRTLDGRTLCVVPERSR